MRESNENNLSLAPSVRRWVIGIGIAVFLSALMWSATNFDKVAYALIVVVFGFFGFYLSEIAKQAIRARHLANQGWVYLLNAQYSLSLESNWDFFRGLAKEWHSARQNFRESPTTNACEAPDYTEVDKAFREKVYNLVAQPDHRQRLIAHFTNLKATPGKIESAIATAERGLDRVSEWNDILPDSEVALLGPEILLHTLNYRTSQHMFWQKELAINTYLKHASQPVEEHFLTDVQSVTFYAVKGQLELEMLRPLIERARKMSLVQLSMSLLR